MSGGSCARIALRWVVLPWLALASLACGAREPVSPRRLAVGMLRTAGLSAERAWGESGAPLVLSPAEDPAGFWVRSTVPAASWTRVPGIQGAWSAPRPFVGNASAGSGRVARRLVTAAREYPVATWRGRLSGQVPMGYFNAVGAVLYATTEEAAGPGEATYSDLVELGTPAGGACRVSVEGQAGDGFLLAPGFPCEIPVELEEPAQLVFRSCTLGRGDELTLEVLVGTALVHREPLTSTPHGHEATHRIELAAGAGPLTLRVVGAPAVSAIVAPILAPILVPRSASSEARPADIVLFLADTYRADNLEAYGGAAVLAPSANRLAREGVVFTRAFAPSPWTLPSHASLFSSLYPPEVAVETPRDGLSGEVVTLAERLQSAGYRTAAVTDDAFVSPEYGLDQGFESFDARRRAPEETLRAVEETLARDDGRPLFLFVHSYRAHHPYVVGAETRARLGDALGLRPDLVAADYTALPASIEGWTPETSLSPEQRRRMSDYEALYRGASADMDRLLGECLAVLRAQGCADVVLFTSDHGEAFWEHGVAEHGNGVWNEHLAVPLVLVAPGLAPGTSSTLASLIDVPRTLAHLAGLEPERGWGGVDLLAPAVERSVLAFQCDLHGAPSSLALFAGEKKLLFEDAPDGEGLRIRAAFDLALDPEERQDRRAEAWAVELVGRGQRDIGAARQAKVAASAAAPGDAALEELGHLGYGNR